LTESFLTFFLLNFGGFYDTWANFTSAPLVSVSSSGITATISPLASRPPQPPQSCELEAAAAAAANACSKQDTAAAAAAAGRASWVTVTENDALQVVEADAEASFGDTTASVRDTTAAKPHSSVESDGVQASDQPKVIYQGVLTTAPESLGHVLLKKSLFQLEKKPFFQKILAMYCFHSAKLFLETAICNHFVILCY
jgi:hypothetical protein